MPERIVRYRARYDGRGGASDWVIDVGPGAGDEGGRIVASGLPKDVAKEPLSRTAKYLAAAPEGRDIRGQARPPGGASDPNSHGNAHPNVGTRGLRQSS